MRARNLFIAAGLLGVGCTGSYGGFFDPPAPTGSGGLPTVYTIQQINDASMMKGTPIAVEGAVVTAIDTFGGHTGNIWVSDPAGGPYSGILIFSGVKAAGSAVQVGSVVSFSGQKDIFMGDVEIDSGSGAPLTVTIIGN